MTTSPPLPVSSVHFTYIHHGEIMLILRPDSESESGRAITETMTREHEQHTPLAQRTHLDDSTLSGIASFMHNAGVPLYEDEHYAEIAPFFPSVDGRVRPLAFGPLGAVPWLTLPIRTAAWHPDPEALITDEQEGMPEEQRGQARANVDRLRAAITQVTAGVRRLQGVLGADTSPLFAFDREARTVTATRAGVPIGSLRLLSATPNWLAAGADG